MNTYASLMPLARKVMIIRGTERYNFNYRDYVQGKRPEENILLEGGDVIVVP